MLRFSSSAAFLIASTPVYEETLHLKKNTILLRQLRSIANLVKVKLYKQNLSKFF